MLVDAGLLHSQADQSYRAGGGSDRGANHRPNLLGIPLRGALGANLAITESLCR
jgi:Protein of unknown function (DUF2563)